MIAIPTEFFYFSAKQLAGNRSVDAIKKVEAKGYTGGLGAEPPAGGVWGGAPGSRGRAPGHGVGGGKAP